MHSGSDKHLEVEIGSVEPNQSVQRPTCYQLFEPHPNPCNPQIRLTFSVPAAADVSLSVYDPNGQEVARVFKGFCPVGTYDAIFNAFDLPTGTYRALLKVGRKVYSQNIGLIR